MSVISNTTVLSNFAQIGALDMLHRLYRELFLATEVFQEVRDGLDEGYTFYSEVIRVLAPMAPAGWLRLTGLAHDAKSISSRRCRLGFIRGKPPAWRSPSTGAGCS